MDKKTMADNPRDPTDTTVIALQDLLDLLKRGENVEAVKDQLISRAFQRLQQIAHRMLGSYDRNKLDEETNGLVAEAYFRLNRSLTELRPETVRQFFGLAALQMRRHLLDKLRSIHGRGEVKRPKITSIDLGGCQDSALPIAFSESQNVPVWTSIDVLESLEKLDDRQRDCLVMLHWYGFTHQEIASMMGVSTKTVQRLSNLAIIQLNSILATYFEHDPKD